jgi:UDP-2,3-diacylglucosamine hydrolase
MPSSLLIADLHLVSGEVDKTNLFIKFCQDQAAQVDQLFILGDLFNTWLGDDLSNNAYQDVIQALKQLSSTTDVFVMDGNRDFLIGADFEKQSGAKLINEPYVLSHHDKKYVLIHGDSLCTDDVNYQKLKKVLRNPITTFIFAHLPKKLRLKFVGQLRKKSVEAQQTKSSEIMDVNQKSVAGFMQQYPDADLIHGHTHRLNTHVGQKFTRYVLGDWAADTGNAIKLDGELSWLEIH